MEGAKETASLPPLEWGGGKVRLECAFLGKTHRFEHDGPFARIGSDPRCELCIPGLPASVCVYLQIGKTYVAVLELVDSDPTSVCEPVYALPGGTIWLQPNARITVEAIESSDKRGDDFSWENFNVEDVRVFPNTLVARSGFFASGSSSPSLRIESTLSIMGTSPSCHMRPDHKHVSRFQAVIFRGEHQGESCRVVDLFGQHPTLVDNQPANGQVLEVGSQLSIANLNFEAVRFLYNASRPSRQVVEIRSQFTTLPLPTKEVTVGAQSQAPVSTTGAKPAVGPALPDLHSMKERLARAIGFDPGPSPRNKVHFPVDSDSEMQRRDQGPDSASAKLIAEGLDRVAKSQERIADQFERLTARLDKVERSLEVIPAILDDHSQNVAASIESLKDDLQNHVARGPQTETPRQQPSPTSGVSKKVDAEPVVKPSDSRDKPLADRKAIPQPVHQTSKHSKKVKGEPSKAPRSEPHKSLTAPQESVATTKKVARKDSPAEHAPERLSWIERARLGLSGWMSNNAAKRRAIAERENSSDPLNLGSQSTSKRTRLQPHEDESELLAASESEDEALVLGSLMGLRYRDARKSFLKWALFAGVLLVTIVVGGPIIWQKIPEGWRELLWQKITFAKTPQEIEYDANFGKPETVPETPAEPSQIEPEKTTDKIQSEQPPSSSDPASSTVPATSEPPTDKLSAPEGSR